MIGVSTLVIGALTGIGVWVAYKAARTGGETGSYRLAGALAVVAVLVFALSVPSVAADNITTLGVNAVLVLWGVVAVFTIPFYVTAGKGAKAGVKTVKENPEQAKGAIGATFHTVLAALGIVATVGEAREEYREEKRQRQREQQENQSQRKRERMQSRTDEALEEAKSTNTADVLWKMNCPNCGMTWATTQDRNLVRSDNFETHNFRIVNERKWNHIQDDVQIQCRAPGCGEVRRFTKDSLWSP